MHLCEGTPVIGCGIERSKHILEKVQVVVKMEGEIQFQGASHCMKDDNSKGDWCTNTSNEHDEKIKTKKKGRYTGN